MGGEEKGGAEAGTGEVAGGADGGTGGGRGGSGEAEADGVGAVSARGVGASDTSKNIYYYVDLVIKSRHFFRHLQNAFNVVLRSGRCTCTPMTNFYLRIIDKL